MAKGMDHQKLAERTGYWPLFRYLPGEGLRLDSKPPTLPLREYLYAENRYRLLLQTHPEGAEAFLRLAEEAVRERWERLLRLAEKEPWPEEVTMDLRTTYLGLELAHPLVASASPFTEKLDGFLRLEDGGAAAIVMHSLFEEQVTLEEEMLDHYLHYGHESYAEALSYFPRAHEYRLTPERHLDLLARAKERVSVPIIASLNGVSRGGWVEYASLLQEAGADALELNLYYIPTDRVFPGPRWRPCTWTPSGRWWKAWKSPWR